MSCALQTPIGEWFWQCDARCLIEGAILAFGIGTYAVVAWGSLRLYGEHIGGRL